MFISSTETKVFFVTMSRVIYTRIREKYFNGEVTHYLKTSVCPSGCPSEYLEETRFKINVHLAYILQDQWVCRSDYKRYF